MDIPYNIEINSYKTNPGLSPSFAIYRKILLGLTESLKVVRRLKLKQNIENCTTKLVLIVYFCIFLKSDQKKNQLKM